MITKTMVISLFALSLLAVTGIGYAAFTSSAYITGNATAGTIGPLSWNLGATACTSSYNTASFAGSSGNSLVISAGNLGPGDYCTFQVSLSNAGSLPGTLSFPGASCSPITGGAVCADFGYSDGSFPSTIGASATTGAWTITIALGGSPSGPQGETVQFTETVTATAT